MRGKGLDHLGKPIGQPAEAGDEQPLHRANVGVEIEARDHRARVGVGIGRAVADEFGKHMDVAGEQRGSLAPPERAMMRRSRKSMRSSPRRAPPRSLRRWPGCDLRRWSIAAPAADWPPSLSQKSGHHAGVIRTPHARHEARLARRRHDAGRRSHDVGEAIADIDSCRRIRRARRSRRCRRHGHRSGDAPTGVPGGRPRSRRGRSGGGLRRARVPGATISVPIRAYVSLDEIARPMRSKIRRAPAAAHGRDSSICR